MNHHPSIDGLRASRELDAAFVPAPRFTQLGLSLTLLICFAVVLIVAGV